MIDLISSQPPQWVSTLRYNSQNRRIQMTDLNLITSESKDEFFEALSKSIWLLLQDKLATELDKRLADMGHNDSEFDLEDHRWQVDEWINTALEEYDMSGHEYQIEEMVNNHLEGKEMEATIAFK
tara:strand:- start:81 stop:455 length:375 start_codon:yes stop_codon:yes gene_type:complete